MEKGGKEFFVNSLSRTRSGEILRPCETRVTASSDFEVVNIDRQLPERQLRVFVDIL